VAAPGTSSRDKERRTAHDPLPLAAAVLLAMTLGAPPPSAAPADDAAARDTSPAPPPADGRNANPPNDMQAPSGCSRCRLAARGQERGNGALKANENPSQSSSTDNAERSGGQK
jgi:hypothetical protein